MLRHGDRIEVRRATQPNTASPAAQVAPTQAVPKSHRPSPLPSTDSSDGKYLATSLSTQAVKMYQRTEDGGIAALLELTGHGAAVTDVTIPLPHEPWLVCSSSLDGTVRLWDAASRLSSRELRQQDPVKSFWTRSSPVGGVRFTRGNLLLACGALSLRSSGRTGPAT